MSNCEKRKYKRLPVTLDLTCRKISPTAEKTHTCRTVNVSPGGLFFETTTDTFKPGNLLKMELSIPPTEGLLEFGGTISGFAKVLRTHNIRNSKSHTRYGVAVEFSQPPKLST